MEELTILVESREPTSNYEYILDNATRKPKKTFAEVGDYILTHGYAIERKKGRDFTGSVLSKRLFKQLINLNQYDNPILAIITENKWKDFYFSKSNYIHKMYQGVLTTITAKFPKIRVLFFEDDKEFLDFVIELEDKLLSDEKSERPILMTRKATNLNEVMENNLSTIPGVGLQMAKKLLHQFGNIHSIAEASEEDLTSIDKLGKKTAKNIYDTMNEKYHKNGNNK